MSLVLPLVVASVTLGAPVQEPQSPAWSLMGSGMRARVGIDGRMQDVLLVPSADGRALFLDDGLTFVKLLRDRSRLTVQLVGGLAPVKLVPAGEATFELSGLREALSPIRGSCTVD